MRVLSFGGGVNSTAMLLCLVQRGQAPDLILFSDTGGEFPETYAHIREIQDWCATKGIEFRIVSNAGRGQGDSLEDNCLKRAELPSLAYGFKGCSVKWKRQPMDRYMKTREDAKALWAAGERIEKCIGIDAGERHRAVLTSDKDYNYRYPLVEWGMDREACIKIIQDHGFSVPRKSSCFFCPAMRKKEILQMQQDHPELLERALAIEANAKTHTVKGLGRNWSWANFLKQEAAQRNLFSETIDQPCGCNDESTDESV